VEIVLDARFRGPAESGNGGYTCGLVAGFLAGPVEVTLRRPPPLGTPLAVARAGKKVTLTDDGLVIAEGVAARLDLDLPPPASYEQAEQASAGYTGFHRHAFPTCFVCGPERAPGDGLRIFAGPLDGREAVAAPWIPAVDLVDGDGIVRPEFLWAALDCPGAFAVGFGEREALLLGRLAAEIRAPVRSGERYVVLGWPLGEDGRKRYAGTALFTDTGELCGLARATWIEPA
jgi:hypothetical protein